MLICRYQSPEGPRHGIVEQSQMYACDGNLFDPGLRPGDLLGMREEFALLPPVAPSKIICVGRNYAAHAQEFGNDVPVEPLLFFKPPSALIGQGVPIQLLPEMGRVDHEAELAVVIGRRGRFIPVDQALSYVLGYTCANDVSDRDFQKRDDQWARAKGFDTFCPLGPWISTTLDPLDVLVRGRVNDLVRQEARTSLMVFNVPALIAHASRIMTLEPGDLLLTGTPAGVGPLLPGDVVEIEIEGIGTLRNPVEAHVEQPI